MEIRDLIRAARERRGWRKAELARRAEVSEATITRIESGTRTGAAHTIAKIARALELDLVVLNAQLAGVNPVLGQEVSDDCYARLDLTAIPPENREMALEVAQRAISPLRLLPSDPGDDGARRPRRFRRVKRAGTSQKFPSGELPPEVAYAAAS